MIKQKRYKAIIFDLDGTLIDSLPYHFIAFKDLLLEHNLRISDAYLQRLMGLSTRNIFKELKKQYRFKQSIEDLREERRYHYFKFLGNRDITFAGVKKLLRELRLKYKLAIATGSSRVVFTHSTDLDFRDNFDFVATITDVRRGKPFPEQLMLCAKKLKVKPKDCLVVGDSKYDCLAAKRAGMDFVHVLTGITKRQELKHEHPILTLNSAVELKKYLI